MNDDERETIKSKQPLIPHGWLFESLSQSSHYESNDLSGDDLVFPCGSCENMDTFDVGSWFQEYPWGPRVKRIEIGCENCTMFSIYVTYDYREDVTEGTLTLPD